APQNARMKGAPKQRIKGTFSPLSLARVKKEHSELLKGKKPSPPPNAPPWISIASYPTSIMDNTCADIDGLTYCVGGIDGGFNVRNSGNVYDPDTDSWSSIASMNDAREKPAVAAIDGKLYVTDGWYSNGLADGNLEIYD